MKSHTLRRFFQMESASGILLLMAAIIALVLANSPVADAFEQGLHAFHPFSFLGRAFSISLRTFVNDGLMTLFFLLIGLELKREWMEGRLSLNKKMILPSATALAGMAAPALIYAAMSASHPDALRGWAIPMATDIAFSLGVLSLFGKRVPAGLIFFLMLLAILDDAGAVMVIALFYSAPLSGLALLASAVVMAGLWRMGRWGVMALWAWGLGGGLLWISLSVAGIHPVLSGALLAIMMPGKGAGAPVTRLVQSLHPWVAFGIMPLFALVNAGVSLQGNAAMTQMTPVVLAIMTGLFIGKPLGILGISSLLVRFRLARLPAEVNWRMFCGVAFLCGIGFTMSLFIGTLAFENQNPAYVMAVRRGVLLGSFFSGVAGVVILYFACQAKGRRVA